MKLAKLFANIKSNITFDFRNIILLCNIGLFQFVFFPGRTFIGVQFWPNTENASEDSGIILKYSHINFVSLGRV